MNDPGESVPLALWADLATGFTVGVLLLALAALIEVAVDIRGALKPT